MSNAEKGEDTHYCQACRGNKLGFLIFGRFRLVYVILVPILPSSDSLCEGRMGGSYD